MGFQSRSGKHFHNPAIGRQHDREAAKEPASKSADGEGQGSSEVHKVEIHHPDGRDNPSPGNHHTVSHYADGSDDGGMDHGSAEEAHAHAGSEMGVGGHELGEPDEDDSSLGGETCPECGTEMQDGTCPKCGYSADNAAIAGQHSEPDQDDEY